MNSLKLILYVLLIIAIAVLPGHTQTVPTMKNVSVINEQGHVRLSWEYDGTKSLEIKRDRLEIGALDTIAIIDDFSTTSYIDSFAQAHLKPRSYRVVEAIGTNRPGTAIVSTYHLTYDYDSCANEIHLAWTDLEDDYFNEWTPSKFIIYVDEEGDLKQFNANATDNSYTVENIQENTHYTFKIGVQWEESPDSIGFSNPINKFTQMPQSPDYINAIYARANGNNTDLKFEIAANSALSTYKLLQSNSPTGNYDTLQTINTSDYEIVATHENSNPESEINYYKLVAINNCGNITTQSDIINNIRLEIENENDDSIMLRWNLHKEYSLVDASYDVYRIAGNSDPELIANFPNHNKYTDNIINPTFGQFCYYIKASEKGSIDHSQSNIACVSLEPEVYAPEAFTPNGDGHNDCFNICGNFEATSYKLQIIDRWGTLIFETNKYIPYKIDCDGCYEDSWKGKYKNGKKVPTGTYIYYLKIKTPGNQIVEKRGNITVFYP